MKKYILFISLVFISIIFFQCKTGELHSIRKNINNSYEAYFNKDVLHQSRQLLYDLLSEDIITNDTIIFIEGFDDMHAEYWCGIYESNEERFKTYRSHKSFENGKKSVVDSLLEYKGSDKLLNMIRKGDLDEIKRKGDASALTPLVPLIINIGVKDVERNRFNFTTLRTHVFIIK